MTDRMAALATLSLHAGAGAPGRARRFLPALSRTIRSSSTNGSRCRPPSPKPATLDRVRALTPHPAFSLANPNRVRALIGAFAQTNQTQFNRADGAGFEFLADVGARRSTRRTRRSPRGSPPRSAPGARSNRCGARAPRRRCGASRRRQICRATSPTSSGRSLDAASLSGRIAPCVAARAETRGIARSAIPRCGIRAGKLFFSGSCATLDKSIRFRFE